MFTWLFVPPPPPAHSLPRSLPRAPPLAHTHPGPANLHGSGRRGAPPGGQGPRPDEAAATGNGAAAGDPATWGDEGARTGEAHARGMHGLGVSWGFTHTALPRTEPAPPPCFLQNGDLSKLHGRPARIAALRDKQVSEPKPVPPNTLLSKPTGWSYCAVEGGLGLGQHPQKCQPGLQECLGASKLPASLPCPSPFLERKSRCLGVPKGLSQGPSCPPCILEAGCPFLRSFLECASCTRPCAPWHAGPPRVGVQQGPSGVGVRIPPARSARWALWPSSFAALRLQIDPLPASPSLSERHFGFLEPERSSSGEQKKRRP